MYQRQLAMVTAVTSSGRSRSPTPPANAALHSTGLSSLGRTAAVTANDPYHQIIMAHVRRSSAAVSRMPTYSFNDANLVTPLDHNTINFSAAGWKCPFCFGMPRQPVAIMTCGHVGCNTCVHEWMVTNPSADFTTHKCPTCRTHFKATDLLRYGQWPLLMKHAWELARVRCENCDFTSSPDRMLEHERKNCEKRAVTCPSCSFCADVETVCAHALTCHHVVVNCVGCNYPVRHTRHMLHDCEAVIADDRRTLSQSGVRGVISHPTAVPVDELIWGEGQYVTRMEVLVHPRGRGTTSADVSAWSPSSSRASSPTTMAMDNVITWLQTVPATYDQQEQSPTVTGTGTGQSTVAVTGTGQQTGTGETTMAATVTGTDQAQPQPQQQTRRYSLRTRRPRHIFDH